MLNLPLSITDVSAGDTVSERPTGAVDFLSECDVLYVIVTQRDDYQILPIRIQDMITY